MRALSPRCICCSSNHRCLPLDPARSCWSHPPLSRSPSARSCPSLGPPLAAQSQSSPSSAPRHPPGASPSSCCAIPSSSLRMPTRGAAALLRRRGGKLGAGGALGGELGRPPLRCAPAPPSRSSLSHRQPELHAPSAALGLRVGAQCRGHCLGAPHGDRR
jgi:hypothetical protein